MKTFSTKPFEKTRQWTQTKKTAFSLTKDISNTPDAVKYFTKLAIKKESEFRSILSKRQSNQEPASQEVNTRRIAVGTYKGRAMSAVITNKNGRLEANPRPASILIDKEISKQIEISRKGISGTQLHSIAARLGITTSQLVCELRLVHNLDAPLLIEGLPPTKVADRIYRIEKILSRASEVLEDEMSARAWIVSKVRSIGGVTPLSLLDTDAGTDLVLDTLSRIEQGIAA